MEQSCLLSSPRWLFQNITDTGIVIVRALASLLQHVGLIQPDKMMTSTTFGARFNDQLRAYALRTSVNIISSWVANISLLFPWYFGGKYAD